MPQSAHAPFLEQAVVELRALRSSLDEPGCPRMAEAALFHRCPQGARAVATDDRPSAVDCQRSHHPTVGARQTHGWILTKFGELGPKPHFEISENRNAALAVDTVGARSQPANADKPKSLGFSHCWIYLTMLRAARRGEPVPPVGGWH